MVQKTMWRMLKERLTLNFIHTKFNALLAAKC